MITTKVGNEQQAIQEIVEHIKNSQQPHLILVVVRDYNIAQQMILRTIEALKIADIHNITRTRLTHIGVAEYDIKFTSGNLTKAQADRHSVDRIELLVDGTILIKPEE